MTRTWDVVTVAAATGSGVMGGVFFAFSAFVLGGLTRLPEEQGAAAMRSINVTAVRPPLMVTLFGTAALCVALAGRGFVAGDKRLIAAAGIYLVGVVALTAAVNVPLNDRLAAGTVSFHDFATPWAVANLGRTLAGVAATALLVTTLTSPRTDDAPAPVRTAVLVNR